MSEISGLRSEGESIESMKLKPNRLEPKWLRMMMMKKMMKMPPDM